MSIATSATSAPASTGVGIAHCTFVDTTRSVLTYATNPPHVRSRVRTLLTEIRYPADLTRPSSHAVANAPVLARRGGYPMVVFAHGYDVTPDTYALLLNSWVRAGFVVVAPFFPDQKASSVAAQGSVNTENDLVNEPADLAFVTRTVLRETAAPPRGCPVLGGLVNVHAVAIAGHSDGANAVAMLAFDHALDPQGLAFTRLASNLPVRAWIILAGAETPGQRYASPAGHPSLLVVQSKADHCNLISEGVALYRDINQPNKWFLELLSAHHLPPFDGVDARAFAVVARVTSRFLQTSLGVLTPHLTLATIADQRPSVARLFVAPAVPSLVHVPVLDGVCGTT